MRVCVSETPAVEDWLPVFMEPLEKGELDVPDDSDPRQTYADYIFYPGRFSTHELLRALNVSIWFIAEALLYHRLTIYHL